MKMFQNYSKDKIDNTSKNPADAAGFLSSAAGPSPRAPYPMRDPARPVLVLLLLGAGCLTAAHAAAPTAGELLQNIAVPPSPAPARSEGVLPPAAPEPRPAPAPASEARVEVRALRISGASAFPEAELQALVADAAGRALTLGELRERAARITRHYRAHGYLLARAYLPQQTVREGVVEIAVLEGRLGERRLHNGSALDGAALEARLGALKAGEALRLGPLERSLLLLDELPGVSVQSTLTPGASVGTTDLDIQVAEGARLEGDVGLDNHGNPHTGRARLLAGLAVNNPLGLADRFALRAVSSGERFNYLRLAWQAPLATSDWQLGAAASAMHYRLGGDFKALQANGEALVASLYALYPLWRSRAARLDTQLLYEHKRLDDAIDSVGVAARKRIDSVALGLSGQGRDGFGGAAVTQGWLRLTHGKLRLDPVSTAIDARGLRTRGSYDVLAWQIERQQHLAGPLSLYASASGQYTPDNLDSSEKQSLGGPYGVRAYPQGEAPSDLAWLGRVELRWAPHPAWQLALFHDAAGGHLSRRPIPGAGDNRRHLAGSGLGLLGQPAAGVNLSASLAWRHGSAPTSDSDRSPRLWLQGSWNF